MRSSLPPPEVDDTTTRPTSPAASRPRHTRSPIYVFTLVVGGLVSLGGWAAATLLEHGIVATSRDVATTLGALPDGMESGPGVVATLGLVGGFLGVNVWILAERRYRRLGLVYASLVAGMALSIAASALLMAVFQPAIRAVFEGLPSNSPRLLPTDPVVAGFTAVVVMCRRWLPSRIRPMVVAAVTLWLASNFALADAPPISACSSTRAWA